MLHRRTVKGSPSVDFARQLAERNFSSQSQKKFRSSAAPKGARLAPGYRDRTLDRGDAAREVTDQLDDKEARVKALEEQMKLGQLERATFEQLRDNITGGDLEATHLVKGLDWKLLERVRRGEVITDFDPGGNEAANKGKASPKAHADNEFAELEQKEIAPLVREDQLQKRGEMAPPPRPIPNPGQKRTRSDILAELRASRRAAEGAKAVVQPQLGDKFRKVGQKNAVTRIEKDKRGREVLITFDEDGNVKRKVRKLAEERVGGKDGLLMPDKDVEPLGMVVPQLAFPLQLEDLDDDIFEGVGDTYDPLGTAEDDASSVSDHEGSVSEPQEEARLAESQVKPANEARSVTSRSPSPLSEPLISTSMLTAPPVATKTNNYFNESASTIDPMVSNTKFTPFADAAILETLKRAAALEPRSDPDSTDRNTVHEASAARRLLATSHDRDLDDMDLGFGSSRYGDEDDDAESGTTRIRLSEWKGAGNDDEDKGENGKGGKQRKRGKKKGMRDKTNAVDVLKVIEARMGKQNT